MPNFTIAPRFSENPFSDKKNKVCFQQRFFSLPKDYEVFLQFSKCLKKKCLGGPYFFQNLDSSVLLNSGPWARVAGLHRAQNLRSQHMIALKMPPAHVRLMFSTTNRFFRIWSCPGHAPAWEITISPTCCRLNCAPCHRKTTILTNLIFTEIQKTPLAIVKLMFFIATVLFLSEQIV